MESLVAFYKINNISKNSVINTVKKSLEQIQWKSHLKGNKIFLKLNLLSQEVVPSQCTSPWIFEGVLKLLSKIPKLEIYYGDADVASSKQVEKAAENWGMKKIGDDLGAKFINLSKMKSEKVHTGSIFRNISIPSKILEMDSIITIPVAKTHCITPFTGALKNQWGLLPRARFQYHPVVDDAIAEINSFFKDIIAFGVADITIGMEGPGPRVGIPKICNVIMASSDLVSLDSAIAAYMGFKQQEIGFLKTCEENKVGSSELKIIGDRFEINPFKRGKGKDYFIYRWRDRLQKIPVLKQIIFTVFAYRLLGYFAKKYYQLTWHKKKGRKYAEKICENSGYREEFCLLINK